MKKQIFGILCGLAACSAQAADYGLGFSISESTSRILVPVKFENGLKLDPFMSYTRNSSGPSESKFYQIGSGIYGSKTMGSVVFYAGGMLSFGNQEYSYSSQVQSHASGKTYSIAPTIGCEYYLAKQVSIFGECGISYQHYQVDSDLSQIHQSSNTTSTFSSLGLKMYF